MKKATTKPDDQLTPPKAKQDKAVEASGNLQLTDQKPVAAVSAPKSTSAIPHEMGLRLPHWMPFTILLLTTVGLPSVSWLLAVFSVKVGAEQVEMFKSTMPVVTWVVPAYFISFYGGRAAMRGLKKIHDKIGK